MGLETCPLVSVHKDVWTPVSLNPVDGWVQLYVSLHTVGEASYLNVTIVGETRVLTSRVKI